MTDKTECLVCGRDFADILAHMERRHPEQDAPSADTPQVYPERDDADSYRARLADAAQVTADNRHLGRPHEARDDDEPAGKAAI